MNTSDIQIVPDALQYYDTICEKNNEFTKNISFFNMTLGENKLQLIELFDEYKNKLGSYEYEILGLYNSVIKSWSWGWSIPYIKKEYTKISKNIFNYGYDLHINNITLRNELITSRFQLDNMVQIDIHLAIAMYLSKKDIIFNYKLFYDNTINNKLIAVKNDNKYISLAYNDDNDKYLEYYLILTRKID